MESVGPATVSGLAEKLAFSEEAVEAALLRLEVQGQVLRGHFRNTEMARDTRYKVVLRNDGKGPNELYDITADPREKVNRYDDPQYVTARDRLVKELAVWRKQTS